MSAGKCKRVAPEGPLMATSSSSSDDDSPRQPPINSPWSSSSALSPSSTSIQGSDHASEITSPSPIGQCCSPDGSSVASGGVLFSGGHHHKEVRRPRSKKKRNEASDDSAYGSPLPDESSQSKFDASWKKSSPDGQIYDPYLDKYYVPSKYAGLGEKKLSEFSNYEKNTDARKFRVSENPNSKEITKGVDIPKLNLYNLESLDAEKEDQLMTNGKMVNNGRNLERKLSVGGKVMAPNLNRRGSLVAPGEVTGKSFGGGMPTTAPQKTKPARAPMPMRQRAFPPSFWQQPNVPQNISPSAVCSILPPLFNQESASIIEVRPVTPPEDPLDTPRTSIQGFDAADTPRGANPLLRTAPAAFFMAQSGGFTPRNSLRSRVKPETTITVTNTELLQKLFEGVDKNNVSNSAAMSNQRKPNMGQLRKFRPRKVAPQPSPAPQSSDQQGVKQLLSGRQDPYLVECIAEKLFPQLSLEPGKGAKALGGGGGAYGGHSTLHVVSLREGDNVLTLPQLTTDHNYGAMLNELVAHM